MLTEQLCRNSHKAKLLEGNIKKKPRKDSFSTSSCFWNFFVNYSVAFKKKECKSQKTVNTGFMAIVRCASRS